MLLELLFIPALLQYLKEEGESCSASVPAKQCLGSGKLPVASPNNERGAQRCRLGSSSISTTPPPVLILLRQAAQCLLTEPWGCVPAPSHNELILCQNRVLTRRHNRTHSAKCQNAGDESGIFQYSENNRIFKKVRSLPPWWSPFCRLSSEELSQRSLILNNPWGCYANPALLPAAGSREV